jgi:hypothetical protein
VADEEATRIAFQNSEKQCTWFEEFVGGAGALARVMGGYKETPVDQRRDYFNMTLRQVLGASPELRGAYANRALDALDGMDADYGVGRYVKQELHGSHPSS